MAKMKAPEVPATSELEETQSFGEAFADALDLFHQYKIMLDRDLSMAARSRVQLTRAVDLAATLLARKIRGV